MADDREIRARIRDFLVTRRSRVTPGDVGIPGHDPRRRVKGLRREEVALLAGISVEYYTRLERGDAAGASPSVINAVARVLRLDDVEREHLGRLFLASSEGGTPVRIVRDARPQVQYLLDALGDVPAFALNKRLDIVAANLVGRALYAPMYDDTRDPVNAAWFHFRNEAAARALWVDWSSVADNIAAILRTELGVQPHDHDLADLIEDLLDNDEFATRWASQNVHRHSSGIKPVDHPVVGRMDLPYESLCLAADPDLSILVYNPEPGSPAYDSLKLLALWARDDANDQHAQWRTAHNA
ncbi:helix-turn-helix transcriptional regulator [Actinopolymorpha alba]|uniref:helix-turn-helix transcriptional regulator n=1 Tax=Actinopolymorpha alba TaxID=533267 RepID=UPI00036E3918|nr:helix-turn-helix transcriptional regulator [Actinopolymorpha alba]